MNPREGLKEHNKEDEYCKKAPQLLGVTSRQSANKQNIRGNEEDILLCIGVRQLLVGVSCAPSTTTMTALGRAR
jgi:hypothetical protein